MTLRRCAPVLLVIALSMTACASDDEPTAEPDTNAAASDDTSGSDGQGNDEGTGGTGSAAGKDGRRGDGGGENGRGNRRGTSKTGDSGRGSESAEDDGSSAYFPAAGVYTYRQSGFEEFCDASRCEKEDLPSTQDVETTHERRAGDEVVVITDARTSDSRTTTVTTRHTPGRALITNVRVKFNYEGFTFDNSYQPDPPVESARYPLRAGTSWSGAWKDSTSGDYRIEVGAKERLSVGGRSVQAFPLHTVTTFEGEFDGRADVTVWVDPATSSIVKTVGELSVQSVFGRYHTEFSATLRSGPAYR